MSHFQNSNYYLIILILSVICTLLFIFTEFAGYGGYYVYSVNFSSIFYNPDLIPYAPIFIIIAFLFLLNIIVPLKELKIIKTSFPRNSVKIGLYTSLGIFVLTAIGSIVFVTLSSGVDWWFGSGFFAAIIGGLLLPILYRQIIKNEHAASKAYSQPPPPPPPEYL
jgi:hypothetical protein